jgi:hypothetical protein
VQLRVRGRAKRRARPRETRSRQIPQCDNFTAICKPFQLCGIRRGAFERHCSIQSGSRSSFWRPGTQRAPAANYHQDARPLWDYRNRRQDSFYRDFQRGRRSETDRIASGSGAAADCQQSAGRLVKWSGERRCRHRRRSGPESRRKGPARPHAGPQAPVPPAPS